MIDRKEVVALPEISEEVFAQIVGRIPDLTEAEIDVLREDLGLEPKNPTDKSEAHRRRTSMLAWEKVALADE